MRENLVTFNKKLVWVVIAGLLLCISLLNCSAYFNTLYNGNEAFKAAQVIHKKAMKNFPDSSLVAAPTDAIPKYDRAIEKATKVVDGFPKKKKWHDEALLLMGKSHYFKKEFEKSIFRLKELQIDFPASPYIPESYIYIGRCNIELGNFDKAEEALQLVITKYPNYNKNQEITMLMVEIAIRREGRAQAIGLLEQVMKSEKSESKRADLILRISQLYVDMKQYQKAIPLLLSAPRKKDNPEQAYHLDILLITCYIETGKLDAALQLSTTMSSSRLYQAHYSEIMYKKGMILKQLGRFDEAIDAFKSICKDIDSTKVKSDTSSIDGKAFYELGMLYLQKKSSNQKAIEYLDFASQNKDTVVAALASKRYKALKRLDTLRNTKKNVTADSVKLIISELLRYDLDEPDSAYNEYIKMSKDTATRKQFIPKALCAAAIIAHDDLKDTLLSDSLFKRIIAEYPSSEYAQLAQKQMNVAITVVTRQDSANAAYHSAEETFYLQDSVKDAIRAFFDVYKKYPELDIAPKSLFAAAWFTDNVLEKKSTAKSLYEKICEKYPKSQYCTGEAKPRIDIVKDTLAALDALRKKLETQQNRKKSLSADTAHSTTPVQDGELFTNDELGDKKSDNKILSDTLNKPIPKDSTKSIITGPAEATKRDSLILPKSTK